MKVTFILPSVGKKHSEEYVRTWKMEPLAIAVLSALTPPDIEKVFYDDRLEDIPYDEPTHLAAINVETYSARRAYQIAAEYKKRNIPVVMGGFHATLMPHEVLQHADAVVLGAAEPTWKNVLDDFKKGTVKKIYSSQEGNGFSSILPDRTIYKGKKYTKLTLIETGRGCPHHCEFCSICRFFNRMYYPRPVEDVIEEIKVLKAKYVFFIDDNFVVDREHTVKLLKALVPLKIQWVGQVSLSIAKDREILSLMKASGCIGVLIGFESLCRENLEAMGKSINSVFSGYDEALEIIRQYRFAIYATFIFGYDNDDESVFRQTYRFAMKHKFFFTAFNHVVPFPGTPLYTRLEKEGKLLYDSWWLSPQYRFGDIAFKPARMSAQELSQTCFRYRKKFYGFSSIIKRGIDFRCNVKSLPMLAVYIAQSITGRKDIERRQGLPLGIPGDEGLVKE